MSAHCNECGTDLVHGHGEDWQLMTCPVCTLREELTKLRQLATAFGQRVLDGDTYGCENGPGRCLHMDAKKFLDKIAVRP